MESDPEALPMSRPRVGRSDAESSSDSDETLHAMMIDQQPRPDSNRRFRLKGRFKGILANLAELGQRA